MIGAGRVGAVLAAALAGRRPRRVVAAAGESDASRAPHRRRCCPACRVAKPTAVARGVRPAAAHRPRRHARQRRRRCSPPAARSAPGQFVVHTSGRHGLAVLEPAPPTSAPAPLAMHPAMTFTGTAVDLDRLRRLRRSASPRPRPSRGRRRGARRRPRRQRRSGSPRTTRTLYHAGLAHGANHLVTLVTEAMDLLRAAGADDPAGDPAPAADAPPSTTRSRYGDAALTGPIVRGDVEHRPRPPRRHRAPRARDTLRVVRRAGPGHRRPGRRRRPAAADPRPPSCVGVLDDGRWRRRPGRRPRTSAAVTAGARSSRAPATSWPPRSPAPARAGGRVALVPTMGALHDGPRQPDARRARERVGDGAVVVSIFVNPLQFGPGEDLDRYPRTLDADLEVCAARGRRRGVRAVGRRGLPGRRPAGHGRARARSATVLEGATRPGHFRGVLTVVAKLFGLVRPDVAVFGAEGLPAARADPPDGRRPLPGRRGRRRRRPSARPTAWRCPRRNRYLDADAAARRRSRCPGRCAPAADAAAARRRRRARGRPAPCCDARRGRRPRLPRAHRPRPRRRRPAYRAEARLLVAARVGTHPPDRQHRPSHLGDPASQESR